MKITDSCVCPYPHGDSSVRRMALAARDLGFDSILAVDCPAGEYAGIEIISGTLIRERATKDVINRVKRAREQDTIIMVQAGDSGFNRAVISLKGVHVLSGIQLADKKAFDHVTAKMAADSGVAVDIDLTPLVAGRGIARQKAIHRYRDILMFAGRFGFPVTISSHAHSVLDMRSVREISGICTLIGMDIPDVERALAGIETVTTRENPSVRVLS